MTCSSPSPSFEAEEILWPLHAAPLRVARVRNLAGVVDCEALLRDEKVAEPPYWAHLWPAAKALARMLAQSGQQLKGRLVLDLGCGLGLPGLVAAHFGASVVFSDRNVDALTFARFSAMRNRLAASFVAMDWSLPALERRFDLCVAADVSYDPKVIRPLVDFLAEHIDGAGEVWLGESVRAEEGLLPELLARRFEITVEHVREIEDDHVVWVRILKGRPRT